MTDDYHLQLPTGTQLRHYVIESVMGQGGFGVVYKARHAHLNEQVVIKEFLPSELAGRSGATVRPHSQSRQPLFEEGMRRFLDEGRTLVKLRHPNVVRCRDLFTDNGTAYLIMDYEDGLPLDELVRDVERNGEHYTERQLCHFLIPLAEGLAYVHQQGVLHRDIKPANVFIRRSDGTPVILDFGAAKQDFALGSRSRSMAPFTEFYAPLEQTDEGMESRATLDVHAFGGLMYRLVTGQLGPKAETRAMAIAYGKPDPLTPVNQAARAEYSRDFFDLIGSCLAFRADDRVQTMEEVRSRLVELNRRTAGGRRPESGFGELDELLELAGADQVVTDAEMKMLLAKAETLRMDPVQAQQYIIRVATSRGWQLLADTSASNNQGSDASREDSNEESFSDIFGDVFGDTFGGGGSSKPADLKYHLKLDLEEVLVAATRTLTFSRKEACPDCLPVLNAQFRTCERCGGSGQVTVKTGFFRVKQHCPDCQNRSVEGHLSCQNCGGKVFFERAVELRVKIPAGMGNGDRLRFRGEGDQAWGGHPSGDLYVEFELNPHPVFAVEGKDLLANVNLVSTPKPGDKFRFQTLEREILIRIPDGYTSGQPIRIRSAGLPSHSDPGRGHIFLRVYGPGGSS